MNIAPQPDARAQLENEVHAAIHSIAQIDRILKDPVAMLLHAAHPGTFKAGDPLGPPPRFPVWVSARNASEHHPDDDNSLAQGVCAYTLQRLSRIRRRFDWLDKEGEVPGAALLAAPGVRGWLARGFIPAHLDAENDPEGKQYFEQAFDVFRSRTYGSLNPVTAAQIFRTLIEAGEDYAHEGIGFLAFFAMVWPLYRTQPDPLLLGARIEPSTPTAYVTAKCLVAVEILKGVCKLRAEALGRVAGHYRELHELAKAWDPAGFSAPATAWKYNVTLDRLRTELLNLSQIAIAGSAFRRASDRVGDLADAFTAETLPGTLDQVQTAMREVVQKVGETTGAVLDEAQVVVAGIQREIIAELGFEAGLERLMVQRGMRFDRALLANEEYRSDLVDAATRALDVCATAIDALSRATAAAQPGGDVQDALSAFVEANYAIRDEMHGILGRPANWCRSIVDREVAFASARNMSEFDPSELTSALLVAVRLRLASRLQVKEAVSKAVMGAQPDGSWRLGHPYFSPDDQMGMRPPSADIVWTLARCIEGHPDTHTADDALLRFVDWLERTRRFVGSRERRDYGWRGDRMRYDDKLHLATTAYAINALLEIRELLEYRLWELCKKRFTVVPTARSLDAIDPVDLGLPHRRRLHSTLSRMSRLTTVTDLPQDEPDDGSAITRKAEQPLYSLVLHGPPGSSKTVLIEGLAADMWRSGGWGRDKPPLIRITPADFTRRGESRIDSEARLIFDLLSHVRRVTILFDEIDDLLAQRLRGEGEQVSFIGLVVPAMLNRLQDLRDACRRQEICFVLGTNYIDSIEPALVRRGRIDRPLPVVYPDFESRQVLVAANLEKWLGNARLPSGGNVAASLRTWMGGWRDQVVRDSAGWSRNEIVQACEHACDEVQDALDEIGRRMAEPRLQPPAQGHEWEWVRQRLMAVEGGIDARMEQLRAGITPPEYARRLCMNGGRGELRSEYIQYRICSQKWAPDADVVTHEVERWEALRHPGGSHAVHRLHTEAFRRELQTALAAVGRGQPPSPT